MTAVTGWGDAPTVLRIILGKQLQELRSRAGLSFEQAGRAIDVSHSTIRRMESAKVARLRLPDVEMLLRAYGITDEQEIENFLDTVREANKRGWWHDFRDVLSDWFAAYLSLEQAARHIRAYEPQFVHGLLQTEDYARAQLAADCPRTQGEPVERRLALRMQRQRLLRGPEPPRLWVVMDETALRRPLGGPQMMREQLDYLCEMNELPHVTIQLMPFANGPHPALRAGPFHLFRFRAPELPDVVYLTNLVGAVYLDKREDVLVYREALDRLGAQAAQGRRTADILLALRKEF